MSYSQWRQWLSNAFTRGARRRGRKEFRPVSELLEKRCLFNITPVGQHNVGFVEGNANTVLLATFTDTTPSTQDQYAATIHWGDGSPPDTTSGEVFATGGGHYLVLGTHTYGDESGPVTFTVNLQETGNGNDAATTSGTAIAADAPLTPFAITFSPTEGSAFTGTVASFTDQNPTAPASDFSATIDWGDGSSPTAGTVMATGGGNFDVLPVAGHSYADDGSYSVTVTLHDEGGLNATLSSTAAVQEGDVTTTPVGVTLTYSERDPVALPASLGGFTDPGTPDTASDYTAVVNWGDNTTSAADVTANGGSSFLVRDNTGHSYADEGSYTVIVTISENGQVIGTITDQAQAAEADVIGSGHVSATGLTEGQTFSGTVATFDYSTQTALSGNATPAAPASDFTATINWGDNGTSVGSVSQVGSVTYDGPVTVTVYHGFQSSGDGSPFSNPAGSFSAAAVQFGASQGGFNWHPFGLSQYGADFVGNLNVSATATYTFPVTSDDGSQLFIDGNSVVYDPGIHGPTTVSGSATLTAGVHSFEIRFFEAAGGQAGIDLSLPSLYAVSGNHTYVEDGPYLITVQLNDDDSGTATGTTAGQVVVGEGPLTVTANGPYSVAEGTTISGTVAQFTHPGNEPDTAFTATINWGDGKTSIGTVHQSGPSSYDVTGNHAYIEQGSFTVTISVADGSGTVGSVTEFANPPAPGSGPARLTVGPDGSVWFTEFTGDKVAQVTPQGSVNEFAVTGASGPNGIALGPDGNFWFAETNSAKIGEMSPQGTLLNEFSTGLTPGSQPIEIVAGPDGALWFTEVASGQIGRITTAGLITEFPTDSTGSEPIEITVGPDGNLWFGELGTGSIGVMSPAGTLLHEYPAPGGPVGVTFGPDGNLWFAEYTGNKIGQMSIQGTVLNEYPIPTGGSGPWEIVPGPDGALWFTERSGGQIGRITTAGSITEVGIPTPSSQPLGITAGPDGALWFTEFSADKVGRYTTVGGSGTTTATVSEPPTTLSIAVVGTINEGSFSGTVATFTHGGGAEPASEFAATIDWGDGSSPTAGTVVSDGQGGYAVLGSHPFTEENTYTVSVTVGENEVGAATVSQSGTLTVVEGPFTLSAGPFSLAEGDTVFQVASFTHADQVEPVSDFTVVIDWGDSQGSSGSITNNGSEYDVSDPLYHSYVEEGTYTVTITLLDDGNIVATQETTATVSEPPIFFVGAGTSTTFQEGQSTNGYQVAAFVHANQVEPAGDFTATIDWGDGTTSPGAVSVQVVQIFWFSFTEYSVAANGPHAYGEEGTYTVTVTLSEDNVSSSTTFSQDVQGEPAILSHGAGTLTLVEGQVPGDLATFTHANGVEPTSDFSAAITWGDNSTSAGTITLVGTTYHVQGNHSYAEAGSYSITVKISEDGGTVTALPVTDHAVVTEGALTVTVSTSGPTEGTPFTGTIATFTHANGVEPASDFTASINWGDNSTSAGTVTLSGTTYSVTGSHTYAEDGPFTVSVTVSEDAGAVSATGSGSTSVAEGALTVAVSAPAGLTEGQTFSGTVASFTHANGAEPATAFTATINWGDNGTSAGSVSLVGSSYQVTGSHAYAEDQAYTVTVTVNEDSGAVSASGTGSATVSEGALTVTAAALASPAEGAAFSGTVATFTHANGSEPATAFTATINWGDNGTSAGSVSLVGTSYKVTGSHTYAEDGPFTVTVTVNEDGGAVSASGSGSVTVTEGPITVSASAPAGLTEGQTFSGTVATFTHANGSEPATAFAATINWGDNSTSAGTVTLAGTTYSVAGSHTYAEDGPFTVSVKVSEDAGAVSASGNAPTTVSEGPLTVTASSLPLEPQGQTFSGTVATFTHAGGVEPATAFAATINWGDTHTSAGTVTLSGTTYSVTGSHAYSADGSYTVTITVNEDSGAVSVSGSTTERVGRDVSNQISAMITGFSFNRVTGIFTGTLTLTNTTNSTINGPFAVAFNNLAPGYTVVNPDGKTAQGSPYVLVNVASLPPGGHAMRSIQFHQDPGSGSLTFQFQIFSLA